MLKNTVHLFHQTLTPEDHSAVTQDILEAYHNTQLDAWDNNISLSGPFIEHCRNSLKRYAEYLWGEFDYLTDPRSEDGWAYVSNCDTYKGRNIHTHQDTCTVTGVYYLSVPDQHSGAIDFWNNHDQHLYTHQPVEGDFLVFPSTLRHSIQQNQSKQYRISINVELLAEPKFEIISHTKREAPAPEKPRSG